jgi:hypothetical protein
MEPETSQTRPAQVVVTASAKEAETPVSPPPDGQISKRTQIIIIVAAVLFVVILVAAIVLMATFEEATQVIRDIAIVFVAVETFLIGLAMLLLIFQIQMLIQVLRDEIQPLLRSVNDTASTVRGTTEFVSHNVVSPVIKLAGFSAAVQRVTRDLIGVVGATRPRKNASKNSKGGNVNV